LAASFNTAVLNGLAGFKSDGLKVFTLDTYDLLGEIEADPSHFGFTNVSDPCWTGSFTDPKSGMVCSPDPSGQNQFLFWDEVHPTEAGHFLTAEFALDALTAVPEVSTWAMMLIGFAGFGFAGYRRSRQCAITA
jgi:phospholipase/lecithinase/hemolysin